MTGVPVGSTCVLLIPRHAEPAINHALSIGGHGVGVRLQTRVLHDLFHAIIIEPIRTERGLSDQPAWFDRNRVYDSLCSGRFAAGLAVGVLYHWRHGAGV